jgi:hypothetical protein
VFLFSKTVNLLHFQFFFFYTPQVLKDTPISPMLACITGGYNIKERLRCINELKGFGAAGYVIEGFHTNGESATNLLWEDVEPVLTENLVRYQSFLSWQTLES